jgi:hypothetical protein
MRTPLRRYYRGHNLVGMRDVPAGATRYYHFDHQGTTQCLTDSAGAVTDRFASDAWGVEVKRTGSSDNRYWYRGAEGLSREATSQLVQFQGEYSSGLLGRWLAVSSPSTERSPYAYPAPSRGAIAGALLQAPPPFCKRCNAASPPCNLPEDPTILCGLVGSQVADLLMQQVLGGLKRQCICEVTFRGTVKISISSGCFEARGLPTQGEKPAVLRNCIITNLSVTCANLTGRARASCASQGKHCKKECAGKPFEKAWSRRLTLPAGRVQSGNPFVLEVKLTNLKGTAGLTGRLTQVSCVERRACGEDSEEVGLT